MQAFDYVIVGAGSAGCVLAARLSENFGPCPLVAAARQDLFEPSRMERTFGNHLNRQQERIVAVGPFLDALFHAFEMILLDDLADRLAVREIAIEGRAADPGAARDLLQRNVEAFRFKQVYGGLDQALAVLSGVPATNSG